MSDSQSTTADITTPTTAAPPHNPIRIIVRGAYDIQRLRIQMGNRIVAQFKAKLGQIPQHGEDELSEEALSVLKDLRADFKKMMDGVKTVKLATFKATPLISTFTEFSLLQQYLDLEESEKRHFANLGKILLDHPIYNEFLSKVAGIGPALAGVIVSEIDIHRSKYPSSIHQYCGLGVESDGRGTSKRKEHLHTIGYTDKEGNAAERQGIRHNPFIKSKLMGVAAGSFLRQADSPYRQAYLDYKHRLQSHPNWVDKTKGHVHMAAQRYAVKRFLTDLYVAWRTLEKLPVHPPYSAAKLGMQHGNPDEPRREDMGGGPASNRAASAPFDLG